MCFACLISLSKQEEIQRQNRRIEEVFVVVIRLSENNKGMYVLYKYSIIIVFCTKKQ